MHAEGEGGNDPEVSSASSDRPEEIWIDVGRRCSHLTVCAHDARLDHVVAREPVVAPQPPVPTAERESGDPGVGHDTSRCRQPVELGLAVDIAPQGSALDAGDPRVGVDLDAAHEREIDHHAAVGAREARDGVTATADGHLDLVLAGEVHRVDDIRRSRALHDEGRVIGLHGVERTSHLVVTRI